MNQATSRTSRTSATAAIPSPFTVYSWNACSLLARAPSIQLFLTQQCPSILIIIEPRIPDNTNIPAVPFYHPVYIPHANQHSHGGLVIYFHTSIIYQQYIHTTPLPSCTHDTATTTCVFHIASPALPRPFVLVPLYMSCHCTPTDWAAMLRFVSAAPSLFSPGRDMPTLVMGDLNARDPMWDNDYTPRHGNSSGACLNRFLSQLNDWHLLNLMAPSLQPTYFPRDPTHQPSVIDLALCNDFNLVDMFHVEDRGLLLSDHAPICATLHTNALTHTSAAPTRYIWNTSRTDIPWDIFQAYLAPLLRQWRNRWAPYLSHTITFTQHDISTCWGELRQIILNVAMDVVGKKPVSHKHTHWYTIDPAIPTLHLRYIRLNRKRFKLRGKGRPVPPALQQECHEARQAFNEAKRAAKDKCWEELVQQVSHNHHVIWTAWHRTVPTPFHPLPTFTSPDPTAPPCLTPVDNLNIIGKHFESVSTLPDDPSFNKSMDQTVQSTLESLTLPSQPVTLPFTEQQLADACAHVNTNTALGPDDISPHFLKHGGPMLMSCLFLMFHLCYQHGVLPSQLTDGLMVALYKNRGDKHQPNNYRPINVTSVVIRLFEKLMLPTLQRYMSCRGIPSCVQFGFTKGRSTYDAILRLMSFVGQHFYVPIPAVFIDISKAYDRVWVHGLIYKLHTLLGMSMHDLFFYRALLSNRTFRVLGNGLMSCVFATPDGVPQGAVSAPYLFIIYIHELVALLQSTFVHINLFADDIVLWASATLIMCHPTVIMTIMQLSLNTLARWASTWKITFSDTKTQMIIFHSDRTLPSTWRAFKLTLSYFTITIVSTYTYLGLVLHKRLSWDPHIKEMIRKATATCYHISRLAFYTIRARPSLPIIRQLINAVLVPKLAYALPFINMHPNRHPLMVQLKRLLIIPLRRSLGLPHNAHHDSIFVETRTLPPHYLQMYHSLLFARRYIAQATSPAAQQERFGVLFRRFQPNAAAAPTNPLYQIAQRCMAIRCTHTTTLQHLMRATNKQLWDGVFSRFYDVWHLSQHPSTRTSPDDTHSLFPCYAAMRVMSNTSLPSYLHLLSPSDASIVSRLRFNRARLNQSLHKRHVSPTDKCPTCPGIVETVEHVLMSCPRYDALRFRCFCALSAITTQPPLSYSFPFPFLLCSFPDSVIKAHANQFVHIISSFLSSVQRMRNM